MVKSEISKMSEIIEGYRYDPVGYFRNILGMSEEYIWPKMVEVAEAVRDHQLVCIRAGHFVSKTFSMGRIVNWFKVCFQPSTVITTAPSDNQVRNQLWREIHASYAGSRLDLGGQMHTLSWDFKPSKGVLESLPPEIRENWEKNFAIGFSTSPDMVTEHATKMQGWHNEWVLVVVDEACGIMPQIWRTIEESLINDDRCKLVAIGNPTDPESDFARACRSSDPDRNEGKESYISDRGYYVITIDSRDNPNYIQRKRIIPGLASYEWVQRIISTYGEDGDGTRYRVKGLFPLYAEGTIYGKELAQARKNDRIGHFPVEPTQPVYAAGDLGSQYTAMIFFQLLQGRIRVVGDYYDDKGLGFDTHARYMQNKDWIWDTTLVGDYFMKNIYAGPEHGYKESNAQTGKGMVEFAHEKRVNIIPVIPHSFSDGIETVRTVWPILEIDENCETFIKAVGNYKYKKNEALSTEDKPSYHKDPIKSWGRHMMDALRHLAVSYRHQIVIDGVMVGYAHPEAVRRNFNYDIDPLDSRKL